MEKFIRLIILFIILLFPVKAFGIEEEVILPIERTSSVGLEENIRLAIEDSTVESAVANEPIETPKEKKEVKKAYAEYNYLGERTPLLSEYTKYKSETGILKSFEPSFAYRGFFDMNMTEHEDSDLFYENALLDLNLIGKFQAPVEFKSQFNFLSMGHENYFRRFFKDQYLAFTAIPHNKIYVGYFRAPIGKEGASSSYILPLFNRSQMAKNFGNARAIGTKLEGKYDLVNYNLSVTSSDRQFHEFFPGLEFSGWADLKPLGKTDGRWGELEIGGGINAGRRHDDYIVAGAAVSYKYKKLGLFAEYGISDGSNGSKGFTTKSGQGVTLTATYNITKKLQLVARYDAFDSDRHKSNKTITEYSVGLNYLIKGSALKLICNYIYRHKPSGHDSNRILVGFQIVL